MRKMLVCRHRRLVGTQTTATTRVVLHRTRNVTTASCKRCRAARDTKLFKSPQSNSLLPCSFGSFALLACFTRWRSQISCGASTSETRDMHSIYMVSQITFPLSFSCFGREQRLKEETSIRLYTILYVLTTLSTCSCGVAYIAAYAEHTTCMHCVVPQPPPSPQP